MMMERRFSCRGCGAPQTPFIAFRDPGRAFILVLAVTVLLCGSYLFATEQSRVPTSQKITKGAPSTSGTVHPRLSQRGGVQHKFFSLKHLPAEHGKKYLAELKLGTVSQIPDTNALLVTAQPRELTKAIAILNVVDAREKFVIKPIFPASAFRHLPSNKQIAAVLGNISIGSFSNPPDAAATARAIIDVHNDEVIAVAPVSWLEKIVSAIGQLQKTGKQQIRRAPPLLKSLGARAGRAAEPNESTIEQAAVPAEQPSEVTEPAEIIQPYEPAPIANGEETLNLNLPEKLQIVDLLSLGGEYLGLDFIYDPAKVKGEITLKLQGKLRGPIKIKDLYSLLESVLKFKGFVMSRHKDNLVTVVPVTEILDIDPALQKEAGKVEHGDVVITRIFELKYVDTTSAKNLLSAMKLGAVVEPIGNGTLTVTDYAYRMGRIEQLLDMIDKPGEPRRFRFRQLKYTMAKTLAQKVQTLAEQLETVSITIAAPTPTTVSAPRRGETAAQRRAREARERTARARARQAARPAEEAKPAVYLDADERTNRILMIGLEEQLAVVDELIDALDVEQQDLRTLKLYKIENVDAEEVKKKLQELGVIGGTTAAAPSRITAPVKPTEQPSAARSRATGTMTEALVEEPQVVTIESTNSLLVNATAEQHAQIVEIINYVDSEMLAEEIPYKLYPLENSSPDHLAEVIESLIQEVVKDKEGKIERVVKKEEEIAIVPDPNTFSLIVYASKKNQEWIANLIKQLDKRRPQVLIDVALVEITRTEQFEYDLNLIANARNAVTGNIQIGGAILPNLSSFGNELEGGWNLKDAEGKSTGQMQGFYAEDKIQALLTAMDRKDYGRVLAQPKVLVNDNETGLINTSERTYVEESTTSYTSEGIPVTTTKWTEYPAKIELSITPNISEGDLLRLQIEMVREDFEKKQDAPPDYRTSTVETIVTVPDGSTIILGGLTKLNQTKGGSKVPLLGDIPLVGGLFRSISNEDKANKLYIFVKANILRPDETVGMAQLTKISDESRIIFEEAESRFQEKKDWPGIKPKPMEPRKVLGGI